MENTDFTTGRGLEPMLDSGRISHAYIISGGDSASRAAFADRLAAAALCGESGKVPCGSCRHCKKVSRGIHPDVIYIDKPEDKREILVDQIRGMASEASVVPNEAERKVFIVRDAGDMNANAQNAMLKLLEEPPGYVVIILSAENPKELLATVRSRCVTIDIAAADEEISDESKTAAVKFLDAVADGAYTLSTFSFTLDRMSKQEYIDFVGAARVLVAERIKRILSGEEDRLSAGKLLQIADVLNEAADYADFNVSVVHISGLICGRLNGNEDMK